MANFYGLDGDGYKTPPGIRNTEDSEPFGIICKDIWEHPSNELSEGLIVQLLHAKGVRGVIWCLDEKPVIVPDAPPLPPDVGLDSQFMQRPLTDNTLYIRSRWGLRGLKISDTAASALWKDLEPPLPLPLFPTSPESGSTCMPAASASQAPTVPPTDEDDGQFTLHCHTRSYMYPVGIPCHWFGSLLELVCVLRDLIRSEHQSCSCTVLS